MAATDRTSADSTRDAQPAERSSVSEPARSEGDALLAPAPNALRERLGNRGFLDLLGRSANTPPADPPSGPFAGDGDVRVAPFDDPLERHADSALAGVRPALAERPRSLSPVEPTAATMLRAVIGGGHPLDSALRRAAEHSLGARLPDVRVFRNEVTRALGTRAFAYGTSVVLSPDAPTTSSAEGRDLMLHELAHVRQQHQLGAAFIQREPPQKKKDGDWEIETYASLGYEIRRNTKERKAEIYVGGKKWISLTTKAATLPDLAIAWGSSSVGDVTVAQKVAVGINTEADLKIEVDQDVEDEVFKRLQGDRAAIVYSLHGGGTATFTSTSEEPFAPGGQLTWGPGGKVYKQTMERSRDFALPMTMSVTEERHVWINSDVQYANRRYEQITIDKLPNSFPTFDTLEAVKKFLEANPKNDFLVLKMPDGKFVARAVNEEQMRRLTQSIRESKTDLGWLPNLARYNGKAASGQFLTFWLHGKEYASPDAIRDLYHFNEASAEAGSPGSPEECEVYKMGKDSYGRRPLTHTEAVIVLRSFDKMTKDEFLKREIDGFPVVSLRYQGNAKLHTVDSEYFDGRETFRTYAAKYEATSRTAPIEDVKTVVEPLYSQSVEKFLGIELDRQTDNPDFLTALKSATKAQYIVAKMVWRQVADHGNFIATREITKGIEQLKPYLEDEMMRGVVLTFANLTTKQKKDTLDFIGVPAYARDDYTIVLSDSSRAWTVAQGKEESEMYKGPLVGGGAVPPPRKISLATLHGFVVDQLANLDKTIVALGTRQADGEFEFTALLAEGEFGANVRATTYRELRINLDPKKWPHGNVSPGWFPSPLAGDRGNFSSTYDQIFANESNSHDSWELAKLIAKVTLMAVIAVGIMLVAHLAALTIVAALGLEGAAAFVVYSGATALMLSGAEMLQQKLMAGKDPSWSDFIGAFVKNLFMVAAFGGLGRAVEGASFLARTSIMGATMLGISLAERMSQGGFSSQRDFFLWFYENIVMLAAMEAGGRLIRPLDVRIQFWGRARRLGILVPEINTLTGDIGKLQARMADLMQTPHRAKLEAPKLQAETRRLLELQKDLAQRVADKVKDSGDPEAKFVGEELKKELAEVEAALAAMEEADFLLALEISPVGDSPNIFEYKANANAVEKIKAFFPKDAKVEASADGVIRITLPGKGDAFVLYPEGHAMIPVPKKGPIETKLNLNDATADDLINADINGIGKDTAEKIIEGRKKRGGLFDKFEDLLAIEGIGPKTVERLKASGKIEVAPKEKVNIIERQKTLSSRISALVERAKRLNIQDKAVDALKKKQIGTFEEELAKDKAEIDKAESALEAKIKKAGARARKRYERRKSTPKNWLEQVKVERLKDVSDDLLNEALSQIPSGKKSRVTNLSPKQIRAIVLAHMEGVPIRRFLETGKDFTVAQRNRALDLYLEAAEHRILGAGRVLAEMSLQASKFRGGLFVLEQAEFAGFSNIKEFEMPRRLGDTSRFVDIVLKGDTVWVECKDWAEWERNNPNKLADQFRRDLELRNYELDAFTKLRYVFRKPAPRAVADIKAFLRDALVKELQIARDADIITSKRQQELLDAFDAEKDLVSESALANEHNLLTPDPGSVKSTPIPPALPLVPDDDDEDEDDEE